MTTKVIIDVDYEQAIDAAYEHESFAQIGAQLNSSVSVFSAVPEPIDDEPTERIATQTMRQLIYGDFNA